jgi:hypothetical protein
LRNQFPCKKRPEFRRGYNDLAALAAYAWLGDKAEAILIEFNISLVIPPTAKALRALVKELGDDKFAVRENAFARLQPWVKESPEVKKFLQEDKEVEGMWTTDLQTKRSLQRMGVPIK